MDGTELICRNLSGYAQNCMVQNSPSAQSFGSGHQRNAGSPHSTFMAAGYLLSFPVLFIKLKEDERWSSLLVLVCGIRLGLSN
jgi:hypothetical protein